MPRPIRSPRVPPLLWVVCGFQALVQVGVILHLLAHAPVRGPGALPLRAGVLLVCGGIGLLSLVLPIGPRWLAGTLLALWGIPWGFAVIPWAGWQPFASPWPWILAIEWFLSAAVVCTFRPHWYRGTEHPPPSGPPQEW